MAPGALLFLAAAVILTPSALREITESHQLHEHGIRGAGRVMGHIPAVRECRSKAIVMYEVSQTRYRAEVQGCGAHPKHAPFGTAVEVTYLPQMPSVAAVDLPNASTARFNPLALFALWVVGPLLGAFAWFLWRRERSSHERAVL